MMPIMRHPLGLGRQICRQTSSRIEGRSIASLCRPSQAGTSSRFPPSNALSRTSASSLSSSFSFTAKTFTTSAIQRNAPAKMIKDPDHPSGVFYHQLDNPNRYAISFLQQPPSSSRSASIIAYVKYPAGSSQIPIYKFIQQKPDAVETNSAFVELLHQTMKDECVPQDGLIEYEAALRVDGWAHLNGE